MITFIPSRPGVPVLRVVERHNEHFFQCWQGEVIHVETAHKSLADALRQVAQRMESEHAYRAHHYPAEARVDWEVRV